MSIYILSIEYSPGEFYDRNINWLKNKEQNLSQIKVIILYIYIYIE